MSWSKGAPGPIRLRDLAWAIEHLKHSKTLDDLFTQNLCYKGCPNSYIWEW